MPVPEKTSHILHKVMKKGALPMKNLGGWMQRLAEEMEISQETLPRLPLVEICGERRVLIENHRGVLSYGSSQIRVCVSYGAVVVQGCGLELAQMTRERLVICGRIDGVNLIRRENK